MPANGKLVLVGSLTDPANPGLAVWRRTRPNLFNDFAGALLIERVYHPKLRPDFGEGYFPERAAKIGVANLGCDPFGRQHIGIVRHHDQTIRGEDFLFHVPRSSRRKAPGLSPLSSTSKSADPTIAP